MSDDPLDYLRSGGRLDSSGTFTVNPERALEVLAQHQYAQPEEVVLTLLSWAIGAGAHRVDFSGNGLFEHDGRSLIGRALGAPRQGKELTRVASAPPAAAAAAPAASAHDASTPAPSEFQV